MRLDVYLMLKSSQNIHSYINSLEILYFNVYLKFNLGKKITQRLSFDFYIDSMQDVVKFGLYMMKISA